jgi:hypothetical protein
VFVPYRLCLVIFDPPSVIILDGMLYNHQYPCRPVAPAGRIWDTRPSGMVYRCKGEESREGRAEIARMGNRHPRDPLFSVATNQAMGRSCNEIFTP